MNIILYKTNSPINKVNKVLENENILQCHIKNPCDILNPFINIRINKSIFEYNYCYIPLFNRYYFINDITLENQNIYNLNLKIDVLYTYKDEITNYFNNRKQENINFNDVLNNKSNLVLITTSGKEE